MESEFATTYGQCRCCSAEGNHRDLSKEYCWNGIREVYSDIFVECFNLHLSPKRELTSLICSDCILRLRDASSFRILVVNTEQKLLEELQDGQPTLIKIQCDDKISEDSVKQESYDDVKVETWETTGRNDDDWTDDDMFEDSISLPCGKEVVEGELKLRSRFTAPKPLPTRAALKNICKTFAKHLESLKGKQIVGKSLEKLVECKAVKMKRKKTAIETGNSESDIPETVAKKKRVQRTKYRDKEIDLDKEKNPYTVERLTHAANITALLEFSNLTAFKSKFQRAYPCFYCERLFEYFEELKNHQKLDHIKENINKCVLQKYRVGKPDGLVVYADVTDLKCTICNKNIPSLKDLKIHLTGVHGTKMYLELSDRVIPFKVNENNFQCQVCGTLYETFGAVERHMNTHYRNYVCEECDSGFVTKQRLKIHGYLMHSRRPNQYPCEVCHKQFTTQQKKKIHVETVHENVKKYKCNRCPERFNEYFRRHKHMVLVHGVAPLEYKCNVCDKTFDRRYALSTHMRTHIQQKDVQCEICPYKCFTKVELRHHMVKHNGERIHECSVCKKSYAREKTLKEHMRIHTNDRRYVCPVCGQAFIQNCSLKSHIRSHHKEYGLM